MLKRILIVDDHLPDIHLIQHALVEAGCTHEVSVARDGESAFSSLMGEAFDLLILDITLPCVDGLAMLKRFRDQVRSYMPVIVLSGSNRMEHRSRAENLRVDDYIVKATDYSQFKANLAAALSRLDFC